MCICNTKHATVLCLLDMHFYPFLSTSFVGRNYNISAVAYHNNCAFCNKSTKFCTEVENDIISKSGYRAITSHAPFADYQPFTYTCIQYVLAKIVLKH